jgi:hypothetical protein
MTRRRLFEAVALAVVIGFATWFGGWWAVPPVAAVWQLVRPREPAWVASISASAAWCVLLLLQPWLPLARLAARVSGVFHLPPGGVLLLALGYAGLLAWSAARLVRPLRSQ